MIPSGQTDRYGKHQRPHTSRPPAWRDRAARKGQLSEVLAVEDLRDGGVSEDGFNGFGDDGRDGEHDKFVEALFGSDRQGVGHDHLFDDGCLLYTSDAADE